MLLGRKFEELWEGYCKMCEWHNGCSDTKACPYFTPQDMIEYEVGEIVCDQTMRQVEYLKVMADFGGEC